MIPHAKRVAVGVSTFLLVGCDVFSDGASRDLSALQDEVKIAVPAAAIKWEIFGTPEHKGWGVPGPTDYITLVAEIEAPDGSTMARLKENAGNQWIAPESARTWLSPHFQALLKNARADTIALTQCKKYQVVVTKSGRLVDGFACQHEGLLLIHVKLLGPSERYIDKAEPPVFE